MKAILFDIDGTILDCNKAGKISLIKATKDIFGTIGKMEHINFQGKTDPYILNESLKHMGFDKSTIEEKTELLKEKYFEYLSNTIFTHPVTIYPGIEDIIKELSADKNIILGLLTGNFEKSAGIKISRFDLNKYFKMGVYGESSHNRDDLPPVAKKLLFEKFNIDIPFNKMVIIGDTIYDIQCAKKSDAISIAVGTGWVDKEELLSKKPDYFFDDLSDTKAFLKLIKSL